VVYFIKVTKLVKLKKFDLFEDFRSLYYIKVRSSLNFHIFILLNFCVLYYIKAMKFVKISKFGLFEDYRVLYYIKFIKFHKLQ